MRQHQSQLDLCNISAHGMVRMCGTQVTGIMLPLLKFYFHEEVRQAAVQAMPELLRSAYLAAEKGRPGADMGLVKRMLDFIWPPIMEAMAKARLSTSLFILP